MNIPTRTAKTEYAYLKRANELIERVAVLRGIPTPLITAQHVVEWMENERSSFTANTFRQYRCALVFAYSKNCANDADLITGVSQNGLAVRPKKGKTSSGKKKYIPQRHAKRLMQKLRATGGEWEMFAADLFEATICVGLRPIEWNTAALSGNILIVKNAKATNGRANGAERRLMVTAATAEKVRRVLGVLETIPPEINWYDCTRVAFHGVRKLFYKKSCYTLYTARHQYSANMKKVHSRRIVADLMGHKSEKTAAVHYGKRRSAWREA